MPLKRGMAGKAEPDQLLPQGRRARCLIGIRGDNQLTQGLPFGRDILRRLSDFLQKKQRLSESAEAETYT